VASQKAFKTIRLIVTVGWAIYPIGYFLAYMGGGSNDSETLNIVYNLADLVNKAAFGLAIWVAATSDIFPCWRYGLHDASQFSSSRA
jgi:bacteriorhodopsin